MSQKKLFVIRNECKDFERVGRKSFIRKKPKTLIVFIGIMQPAVSVASFRGIY